MVLFGLVDKLVNKKLIEWMDKMEKIKAGVIGCGNISKIYFENAKRFEAFDIIACADLDADLTKQRAEAFNIPKSYKTEELLADEAIDLVINLTTPKVHAKIAIAALEAGKHVYGEKPLAVTREEGKKIIETAKARGLLVGSAPDTFLGGGIQTCRKLIDDGWIGEPVSATAFMMHHGHESWHPNPGFFYEEGAGPMFDMGPYYLTALISLMGPIKRVTGSTKITFPERTITTERNYGKKIPVTTSTQINGVLDFENGAIASIITSFDTWHHHLPNIEIYGTKGSLVVPDPNTFGGPVFVRKHDQSNWSEIPFTHGFTDNSRGIGVADMASSILEGRKPRANGELAFHVLDIMHGFQDASDTNKHYEPISTCEQPRPLPLN